MTPVTVGRPLDVRQWILVKEQKLLAIRPTFSSSEGRYVASRMSRAPFCSLGDLQRRTLNVMQMLNRLL